jgi:hypothetical protein
MRNIRFFVLVFATVVALPAFAAVTDDAIKLAQNGIKDDVIVAWCETQPMTSITAQDVLRLKEGKVPEAAIIALIRTAAAHRPIMTAPTAPAAPGTEYVEAPTATTYVAPAPHYVYDSPYYYGYPYNYGYPYYGWGPSLGFGFNFGGGHFGGHGFGGGHHR